MMKTCPDFFEINQYSRKENESTMYTYTKLIFSNDTVQNHKNINITFFKNTY